MRFQAAVLAFGLMLSGTAVAQGQGDGATPPAAPPTAAQAPLVMKFVVLGDSGPSATAGDPTRKIRKVKLTTKDFLEVLAGPDFQKLDPATTHVVQIRQERTLPTTEEADPDKGLDLSFGGPKLVVLDNGKPLAFDKVKLTAVGTKPTTRVSSVKTDKAQAPKIIKRDDRSLQSVSLTLENTVPNADQKKKKLVITLNGSNQANSKRSKTKNAFLFSSREWSGDGTVVFTTTTVTPASGQTPETSTSTDQVSLISGSLATPDESPFTPPAPPAAK